MAATLRITGLPQVKEAMREMKASVQKRITRKSIRAATAPYRTAWRKSGEIPSATRALQRSVGVVVRTRTRGVVTGHVGAREGYNLTAAVKGRGRFSTGKKALSGADKTVTRWPSRYLHIANNRDDFMASIERHARPAAIRKFNSTTIKEVNAEAAKQRAKAVK